MRVGPQRVAVVSNVGVDSLEVDAEVVQRAATVRPSRLQHTGLAGDHALGLRAGLECLEIGNEVQRAEPGCVDRRDGRVAASLLHQRSAILRLDPARAPGDVVAGLADDLRNVVGIELDRDARDAGTVSIVNGPTAAPPR